MRRQTISSIILCLGLAACQTSQPAHYAGLSSSSVLRPNPRSDSARIPYRLDSEVSWSTYKNVIVEPVTIYRGQDHQFGDLSEADKVSLADYMQTRFTQNLGRRLTLAGNPSQNTLRVRLTLTGAATNTPVIGTLSRFDLAGGVYNGIQSVSGGEGAFTGSVIYAVEIYDAASNRLLKAFIAKQYPNAYDIPASFGPLDAAKRGIESGAVELAAQLV